MTARNGLEGGYNALRAWETREVVVRADKWPKGREGRSLTTDGGPGLGRAGATDPACLALVLDGLLGVRHGPLHVVHRVLHIVLNPVNHLPLQGRGHPSSRGPTSGSGGSSGRTSGKYPEVRESKGGLMRGGEVKHDKGLDSVNTD